MKADKTLTCVLLKYADLANIFSKDLVAELLEHTKINDYAINLIEGYQPLYIFIYSLKPVELETLKTYIGTNLANDFIRLFKSLTDVFIFFVKKYDRSLWLYINYKSLKNLDIKNNYLLPLIGEFLDWPDYTKHFI